MWYKNKFVAPDGKETVYVILDGTEGEGLGLAVADILASVPHYHRKTDETYTLVSGRLFVYVSKVLHLLTSPGQDLAIPRNTVHWAQSLDGTPAHIIIQTVPPWSAEDRVIAAGA